MLGLTAITKFSSSLSKYSYCFVNYSILRFELYSLFTEKRFLFFGLFIYFKIKFKLFISNISKSQRVFIQIQVNNFMF